MRVNCDEKKKFKLIAKKRRATTNFNDDMNYKQEEETKSEFEVLSLIKKNTLIDLGAVDNKVSITGHKGFINYHTKQSLASGTYYFEIEIKDINFDMKDYIKSKMVDDFSERYYENILNNLTEFESNLRIGLIHLNEGDKELCIGSDKYSYGLRVKDGSLINDGKVVSQCSKNNIIRENDIFGVEIHLKPPMPDFLKLNCFELSDDNNLTHKSNSNASKAKHSGSELKLEFIEDAYIKYYLNNKEIGKFEGLFEGDYQIGFSLYNFTKIQANFGDELRYSKDNCNSVLSIVNKEIN